MSTEEGKQAARAVAIDLLGTLAVAANGLDNVVRIVKVMSLVNSTRNSPNTTWSPTAAPKLLGEVLVKGRARPQRIWCGPDPLGACVEIELIAEVA